jgi:hypothetical protein
VTGKQRQLGSFLSLIRPEKLSLIIVFEIMRQQGSVGTAGVTTTLTRIKPGCAGIITRHLHGVGIPARVTGKDTDHRHPTRNPQGPTEE